ncbi:helix-turn-helix domain-containing protein [Actinoplanes sp. NPDC051633]|uniref:TetR/AcrR family transcriptional regulator n=1 Tax=Actinoplanes sp. NPDC051633 TaxID=3155670 RepID=UPI00342261CF
MGLRELKKERTRRLISETAQRLFAERGFDAVRVAEVARAAEVSEASVFNFFPAKEDLFFAGLDDFGDRLVAAVRDREPGTPVLAACKREMLGGNAWLEAIDAGDATARERAQMVVRVLDGSPALQARERRALDRIGAALARELGGSLNDQVVAGAIIGLHAALIRLTRSLAADGTPGGLTAAAHDQATEAFRLLEKGFGAY